MTTGIWRDSVNNTNGVYPINIHASILLIIHVKLILIQFAIRKFKTTMLPKLDEYKGLVLKSETSFLKYTEWRDTQLILIKSLLTLNEISEALIIRIIWLLNNLTKTAFHFIDRSAWEIKGYKFVTSETLRNTNDYYNYEINVLLNQTKMNMFNINKNEILIEQLPKTTIKLTSDEEYLLSNFFPQLFKINSFEFDLAFFSSKTSKLLSSRLNNYLSNEKSNFIYLFPEYPIDKVWPYESKNELAKVLNIFLETEKIPINWYW